MVDTIKIITLNKAVCANVIANAWGYEPGEHHIQINDQQFKEICNEVTASINDIVVEVGSEIIPDLYHADDVRDEGCAHSFDTAMWAVA